MERKNYYQVYYRGSKLRMAIGYTTYEVIDRVYFDLAQRVSSAIKRSEIRAVKL